MRFLTEDEVQLLTGYKQKKRQAEWLAAQGIPFKVSAIGQVVILGEALLPRSSEVRKPELNPQWLKDRPHLQHQECS